MKVAVLSANLGGYDPPNDWPAQVTDHEVSYHRFTDANFPPRSKAMTPRLQCGLVKWFGPDYVTPRGEPLADVYIWIDASCAPTPVCVEWFVGQLGKATMAVFAHPERQTVREEYEFIKARLARSGETYLTSRYGGEWLDQQFAVSDPEAPLVASTAFAYRWGYRKDLGGDSGRQMQAMAATWLHKTRYHLHDQLAFSTNLQRYGVYHHRINENYLQCPALTFTRKRKVA